MPVAAVGFDLDYTLCVPVRDRATLLADAVDAVDAHPIDRGEYLEVHRLNLTEETRAPIFAELLDESEDVSPAELARVYRERVNDSIRPIDGARELLATLGERYVVGLLTNGPAVAQRGKLETLGLAEAFDAVLVSGELPAGKPDARAFRALFDACGEAPEDVVYVGDDPEADVAGGTAAGCRVIQVLRDDGPDRDGRAVAHLGLDSLAGELPGVLATLE